MKPRPSSGSLVLLATLFAAGGVGLFSQWRQTQSLRSELELARTNAAVLERLREENQRLHARQISSTELDRLRADHAALPGLRRELEALGKSAEATR